MNEIPPITFQSLQGEAIVPWLDDIARLRIDVFRDWPYLYKGDVAYEADYLRTYTQAPRSIAVLAMQGEVVVGVTDEEANGGFSHWRGLRWSGPWPCRRRGS